MSTDAIFVGSWARWNGNCFWPALGHALSMGCESRALVGHFITCLSFSNTFQQHLQWRAQSTQPLCQQTRREGDSLANCSELRVPCVFGLRINNQASQLSQPNNERSRRASTQNRQVMKKFTLPRAPPSAAMRPHVSRHCRQLLPYATCLRSSLLAPLAPAHASARSLHCVRGCP